MRFLRGLKTFASASIALLMTGGLAHSVSAGGVFEKSGALVRDVNGMKGQLVNAYIDSPIGTTAQTTLVSSASIAANERLVVTQFCYSSSGGAIASLLFGSAVAHRGQRESSDAYDQCVDFTPGLSVSTGADVICKNPNNLGTLPSCSIAGVLLSP